MRTLIEYRFVLSLVGAALTGVIGLPGLAVSRPEHGARADSGAAGRVRGIFLHVRHPVIHDAVFALEWCHEAEGHQFTKLREAVLARLSCGHVTESENPNLLGNPKRMAHPAGLEPTPPNLESRGAIQLNYGHRMRHAIHLQ
jgi:hypothetical protein